MGCSDITPRGEKDEGIGRGREVYVWDTLIFNKVAGERKGKIATR